MHAQQSEDLNSCHIEELGHTSEIGLRVRADAPEQLFACAAQAMFSLLRIHPDRARPAQRHHVTITSLDGESLMVDWLSELLYLHETSGAIFGEYTILRWTPTHLEADVVGYPPITPPTMHIKAVTYHQLRIQAKADGWLAQMYFDI
jgi:SHS2 domain-containing protein